MPGRTFALVSCVQSHGLSSLTPIPMNFPRHFLVMIALSLFLAAGPVLRAGDAIQPGDKIE